MDSKLKKIKVPNFLLYLTLSMPLMFYLCVFFYLSVMAYNEGSLRSGEPQFFPPYILKWFKARKCKMCRPCKVSDTFVFRGQQ